MKTSELAGALLDYWVAKAEGICLHDAPHTKECGNWGTDYTCTRCNKDASSQPNVGSWHPSSDWAQGGPIIEREKIELIHYGVKQGVFSPWEAQVSPEPAFIGDSDAIGGKTPLIAAMRAYVASKFGENVPDDAPSGSAQ